MNTLEIIAILEIESHLQGALEQTSDKSRYEHTVSFARSDIKNALKVVRAIKENNKTVLDEYIKPNKHD